MRARLALLAAFCCAAHADDGGGTKFSLLYNADLIGDVSGGAKRGEVYAGSLHARLSADLDKALGMKGLTFYADGLATHGGSESGLVGDAQGVSNIAAAPDLVVYEAWLQYNITSVPISILVGRYDLNTEFYVLATAQLFLNASFGIGPEFAFSGVAGPSIYPDTSLGLRVDYKPSQDIVIRAAVLDGVPVDRPGHQWGLFEKGDGVLLAAEAAFLTRGESTKQRMLTNLGRLSNLPPYDDKFAIGGWYYTTTLNDLSQMQPSGMPVQRHGSGGAYAILDRTLWSSGSGGKLSGFLQLGIGDDRVNRFGAYVGAGLAATGFVPGRSDDAFGIGMAIARNGGHFKQTQTAPAATETTFELTYYAPLTGWIALHPDIQYVVHPDAATSFNDALVLQFQVELSL